MRQLIGALPKVADERLLIGFDDAEDAAVYRLDEQRAIVTTIDVISPLVDDPELFGRIAAANALSDVFAMGGRGLVSLSFLGLPSGIPHEVGAAILKGGAEMAMESGAPIVGGHSVESKELMYGLAVVGEVHPDQLLSNRNLAPGMALVLTKPLGTGTLSTAFKRDVIDEAAFAEVCAGMAQSSGPAVDVMRAHDVRAATDVTGFGFLGHLAEMLKASGVGARIHSDKVPAYAGAREQMAAGVITRGNKRNEAYVRELVAMEGEPEPLLLDPQTSGGLLIAVNPDRADSLVAALHKVGFSSACVVGETADDPAVVL